jgi:hypothetical protein
MYALMRNKKVPWHVNARAMKTSINIIAPVIISSGAVFFSCCKKTETPCDKETTKVSINADDRANIPYTGNDTLCFLNQANDTFTCIASGKVAGQDCEDGGGSPDCPSFTKTVCNENYKINFEDKVRNLKIEFGQYKKLPNVNYNGSVVPVPNVVLIIIKDTKFYVYPYDLRDPGMSNYLAQRTFNGKLYKSAYYYLKNFNNPSDTLFFSKDNGIIQFTLNSGSERYVLN